MRTRIHASFAHMIEKIPPEAQLRAIKLEQRMLEEDLLHKRIPKSRDVVSLLSFCSFVEAATQGFDYPAVKLPIKHVSVYRQIINKLVKAGQLPQAVKTKFDFSFILSFMNEVEVR